MVWLRASSAPVWLRAALLLAILSGVTPVCAGGESFPCRGIRPAPAAHHATFGSAPPISVIVRGQPIAFEPGTDPVDSAYVVGVLQVVIPFMTEVLGPPVGLDVLTVAFGRETYFVPSLNLIRIDPPHPLLDMDNDYDNRIDEDPFDGRDNDGDGKTDEDAANDRYWDAVFVHELAHAYQTDIDDEYPSWLIEGMAQAADYFVCEMATAHTGNRNFRYYRFDIDMAQFDLLDQAAAQLFGGEAYLTDGTPRGDLAYDLAECTVLLPVLAETAAGRSDPHPLKRLTDELRREIDGSTAFPSLFAAVDRAWTTAVDGILPPSRWMRGRSVANPFLRDGRLLHLYPNYWTGHNPLIISTLAWQRTDGKVHEVTPVGVVRLLDAHGLAVSQLIEGRDVPPLEPGAYAAVFRDETGDPFLEARTWFYLNGNGRTPIDSREGTTVIFVGKDGHPVDLEGVSVNGHIVDTVPGGVVVTPSSGLFPDDSFTFTKEGRILGTVTRAGDFSRVVPLFIDDPFPPGALSWDPYPPAAAESLTVYLRSGISALRPGDMPVTLWMSHLVSGFGTPLVSPFRTTETPGLYAAHVELPADWEWSYPAVQGSDSWHGGNCFFERDCTLIRLENGFDVRAVHVDRIGSRLRLVLNRAAPADSLFLFTAPMGEESWTLSPGPPLPDDPDSLAWSWLLEPDPLSIERVRVVFGAGAGARDLYAGSIGSLENRPGVVLVGLFPNPSPDGIRWVLELDSQVTVDFEVFDASGRRIETRRHLLLLPGRREIRWNAVTSRGPVPGGIYFLRLSGKNIELRQKAMLVRKRPG